METSHRAGYIFTLSLCFLIYVGTLVVNAFAGRPTPPLFYNSTGDVSDMYWLDITPAGFTFSIWGVIYTWQILWFGYAFSTLCRRGVNGYLYYSPTLLPVHVYIIYIINCCMLVAWLVVWDRAATSTTYIIPAFVTIALLPFLGFMCLFLNMRAVEQHRSELAVNGMMKEVWLIRFLFQNGIACYTTWVSIATLLNLAMLLHYYFGVVDVYTAGSISLGLLSAEVVLWFILDIFLLDRYTRYLFVPYCVLVWALGGAVSKNYPVNYQVAAPEGRRDINPYWLLGLLSFSGLLLIVKVIVMLARGCRQDTSASGSKEDLRKTDQLNSIGQDYSLGSYNTKI